MRKAKPSVRVDTGSTSTRRAEAPARSTYTAYAVEADGSLRRLDARRILVDLGHARVRIDLRQEGPLVAGRLKVTVAGDGVLMVGPGDASSVNLGVLSSPREEGRSSS